MPTTTFISATGRNYTVNGRCYRHDDEGFLRIPVYCDGALQWLHASDDGTILSAPMDWPEEIRDLICAHVGRTLERGKEF